jgi:serine/threonine protein kinase
MLAPKLCPKCRQPVTGNALHGLCPACLLSEVLSTDASDRPTERSDDHVVQPALAPEMEQAGEQIGRYLLREKLGEGGFGVVYVAEQEQPVRRQVALKVIKLGMDTREVIARFDAERQALALMEHPNIAKVLDAGATEAGRPYFVMELVKGIRITDYCDQHHLSIKARLDLFTQVCQAIQHAHQKGIIHRDIKPSNILVASQDGAPVVKVIDFGIAKATQGRLTDLTIDTKLNQFMGTPVYMSPEQAGMSGMDIDTRTDIYALGVLLYQLLTGKTPFDPKTLFEAGLDEIRRTIREVEPPKPSTRLSAMEAGDQTVVAKHRQTLPAKLTNLVRGDLDWIVMKALEKDRARRYETANGFAQDIRRFLADEPVSAAAPSASYRFEKFARRNKAGLVVAGSFVLVLILGIIASTWQAVRARKAEQRAKAALRESEDVTKFIVKVFQSPNPARDGRTITVAETLDRAATNILGKELADQPELRATLQVTLGQTYHALGLDNSAVPLLEQARAYYMRAVGKEHAKTLEALAELASALDGSGRWQDALRLRQEVLILARKAQGPEHADTLAAMFDLSTSLHYVGRREEAIGIQEKILEVRRKVLGPKDQMTIRAMASLASSYSDAGRKKEAFELQKEVLNFTEKSLGPEHPETLDAMHNLAGSYSDAGRQDDAIALQEKVVALSRRVRGEEHPGTLRAMGNLALYYKEAGHIPESIQIGEEVLRLRRKVLGLEHPETLDTMGNLSIVYKLAGQKEEALEQREELLELSRKVLGPKHPHTLLWMGNLAISYLEAKRIEEAINLQSEVLEISLDVLGEKDPETIHAMKNLTGFYRVAGRTNEAVELGEEVMLLSEEVFGENDLLTAAAMENLFECYNAAGLNNDALYLGENLLPMQRALRGPDHPLTLYLMVRLALAYAEAGPHDRAQRLMQDFVQLTSAPDPDGGKFKQPLQEFAEESFRKGKLDWADVLYRKLVATALARGEDPKGANASLGRLLGERAWVERTNAPAVALSEALEAENLLRQCVAATPSGANETSSNGPEYESRLGGALTSLAIVDTSAPPELRQARLDEAEKLLLSSNRRLQANPRHDQKYKRDALNRLVRVYQAQGKRAEALKWAHAVNVLNGGEIMNAAVPILARTPGLSSNLVDLTRFYNARLDEPWQDLDRPDNTLEALPTGSQKLAGVPWDIRGIVQLNSLDQAKISARYPRAVNGIELNAQCGVLHFLQSAAYAGGATNTEIGRYVVHYGDGTTNVIPIVTNENVLDWWTVNGRIVEPTNVVVAWTGNNPAAQKYARQVRVFKLTWRNPKPQIPVTSLDFVSSMAKPAPFLIAITAVP